MDKVMCNIQSIQDSAPVTLQSGVLAYGRMRPCKTIPKVPAASGGRGP